MLPVAEEQGFHHSPPRCRAEGRVRRRHSGEILAELEAGQVRGAHDKDSVCSRLF
jgi:hypothetical protein